MRIVEMYSHLNGHEHILVHKPLLWQDIEEVIATIDAETCRTKVCEEEGRRLGELLLSPKDLNAAFRRELKPRGWKHTITRYWVTADVRLIRKTMQMPAAEQKAEMEAEGIAPLSSYNQTDFVKDRIAIEVQLAKYSFVAYDLFVKHMAFYVGDVIDVGIEIVPMKEMEQQMSSGVPYYENELYNVIREGRGVPAVPLVLVGIAP